MYVDTDFAESDCFESSAFVKDIEMNNKKVIVTYVSLQ